jgi:membrane protein
VDAGKPDRGVASSVRRLRRRYRWLDHLVRAVVRYTASNGNHYAAAIAYFSVLALFPLLMIGFSVTGFVLFRQPELVDDLKDTITELAPSQLHAVLRPLVDAAVEQRATIGVVGLLGAAYSGLGWIGNLREALTAQWQQRHQAGSLVRVKAGDLLALLGLGLAIVLSIALTAAGSTFTGELVELLGLDGLGWAAVLVRVVAVLLAVAGNWLVLVWIIARLPREPVTLRSAAKAAVIGAVGVEVLKLAATLFLSSVGGPASAVFTPVLAFFVFAYLVSRLLLFAAAWAATAGDNQRSARLRRPGHPVDVEPPPAAVIRPAVTVHTGPDARTATGLVGAGALFGLGLAWLTRRR